ncbi:CD22 protein, partial [Atractosteus spatula]|nr:CD22 protein [Atractosteus spatula]
DAPKSTSVSISPSGEIAEGSSVTLTCSSSANPPVKNYSWFKISGTGPLYKGPNYTIINISSADSGQYYCEAQNEIGALNSTAVTLTVKRRIYFPCCDGLLWHCLWSRVTRLLDLGLQNDCV